MLLGRRGRGECRCMGTAKGAAASEDSSLILLELMAVVDPREKWWLGTRRNPKRSGEISQAAFLLKARKLGFQVAMPWGDSERYDFVVWAEQGGPIFRVQVKGTGRLYRRGYEVQPVHATRRRGKRRYTAKEIDVVAAHVQPVDVWYLLPIAAVGRAKSLRFYRTSRAGGRCGRSIGRLGRFWGESSLGGLFHRFCFRQPTSKAPLHLAEER